MTMNPTTLLLILIILALLGGFGFRNQAAAVSNILYTAATVCVVLFLLRIFGVA